MRRLVASVRVALVLAMLFASGSVAQTSAATILVTAPEMVPPTPRVTATPGLAEGLATSTDTPTPEANAPSTAAFRPLFRLLATAFSGTCATRPLGLPTDYNVFTFGDGSFAGGIQGRAAFGGNASLTGVSIGANVAPTPTSNVLVVGGTLSVTNGASANNGNVVVGAPPTAPSNFGVNGGT